MLSNHDDNVGVNCSRLQSSVTIRNLPDHNSGPKPVRFKLACCVDRVGVLWQAWATRSHGDRYDAALTETLTLGYSENWRVTTRDEKLCFHLSVHSKLELDCTDWGQLRWRIANYSVFILCWQCRCSTGSSGSPPVFHECTSHSRALDCIGSSGMHLRRLFPHSAAIMLSCKLTMYSCNAPHARMLRSLVLLRYVAIVIDSRF